MSVSSRSSDSKIRSRKPTLHQIIYVTYKGQVLTTKIGEFQQTALLYRNAVFDFDGDKSMRSVVDALGSGFRISKKYKFYEKGRYILMVYVLDSYDPKKLKPGFEMIPFEKFEKSNLFKHAKFWLEEYKKYTKKMEEIVIVPLESDW